MRIRNVPGIDGLRGIAVLAVIVYHFYGAALPGGFLGVDIFFVLSGFLITSLLIREHAGSGRIDLKHFWVRRARRILPAAVTVLITVSVVTAAIGGDVAVGLTSQFLGSLLFANNWVQIAQSQSYFSDAGVQVFAHYWSLAVEEQFYVVWPLIFVAVVALSKRVVPLILTFLLAVASAVWMALAYNPEVDPSRVYYGTDTHSFGLLIGAFLAFAITSRTEGDSWPASIRQSRISSIVGPLALVGLLVMLMAVNATHPTTYRGIIVLGSLLTAIVLWSVVNERGVVSRIMVNPVLRWLGRRSFSLYLWHWPVVSLLASVMESHSILIALLSAVFSAILAEWSYHAVENPLRRQGYQRYFGEWWKQTHPMRTLSLPTVMAVLLLFVPVALWSAPEKTALQMDLERLQAQQEEQQARAAEERAKAQLLAETERRRLPEGEEIVAIGDSVMLASSDAIQSTYPGSFVDAAVSRHYTAVLGLLDTLPVRPWVVLGFGTNGQAFDGQIEEILNKIGPDHTVVMVLPYGDRTWIPDARQQIFDAAATHDNVVIADWCGAAQGHPEYLREDQIHPSPEGAAAYTKAITDAFERWKNNDRSFTSTCQ